MLYFANVFLFIYLFFMVALFSGPGEQMFAKILHVVDLECSSYRPISLLSVSGKLSDIFRAHARKIVARNGYFPCACARIRRPRKCYFPCACARKIILLRRYLPCARTRTIRLLKCYLQCALSSVYFVLNFRLPLFGTSAAGACHT